MKNEIVDIDILITSKNGNRKTMQSTRITSTLENKEVEPVEPVQINKYQCNIYKKDLSWVRVQEAVSQGAAVVHIRFCSLSK